MNESETMTKSWVFRLIIINSIIYFIQMLTESDIVLYNLMIKYFYLTPYHVFNNGYVWQLFSYMFLHANILHLLVNMYGLLIFGIYLEQTWGPKKFLFYYMVTGIGAGITILIINTFFFGSYYIPTIGASGAVFGILLAFGVLFPDTELLFLFVIPIKAKYFVVMYGLFELFSLVFFGDQTNISNAGHLGGLLFGLLYFLIMKRSGIKFKSKLFKAKLQKMLEQRESEKTTAANEKKMSLENILNKVKKSGWQSLTDDEYQYIKYMEIMLGDVDTLCIDEDFNLDDNYCKKCENVDACILRELKKYRQ